MRVQSTCLSIVAFSALMVACSGQPTQSTPASVKPAPTAAAAVSSELLRKGYQPVKRQDQLLYCRSEPVTGTKFKRKVCLSESQIAEEERKAEEMGEEMRKPRTNPACATQTCG
jgi:hypothetical protein